jgi:hypothetical protein
MFRVLKCIFKSWNNKTWPKRSISFDHVMWKLRKTRTLIRALCGRGRALRGRMHALTRLAKKMADSARLTETSQRHTIQQLRGERETLTKENRTLRLLVLPYLRAKLKVATEAHSDLLDATAVAHIRDGITITELKAQILQFRTNQNRMLVCVALVASLTPCIFHSFIRSALRCWSFVDSC